MTNRERLAKMGDIISRQAVIDLWDKYHPEIATKAIEYDEELRKLPPTEPFFDKGKVSNLLYHIYSICSPHADAMAVATRNYYFKELGKELFGDDIPVWMGVENEC